MAKQSLKDIIKIEYQKCASDPIYFMKKYCMIQHPVRGKIPFHLYQFQERTLTEFSNHRYNIILKSIKKFPEIFMILSEFFIKNAELKISWIFI